MPLKLKAGITAVGCAFSIPSLNSFHYEEVALIIAGIAAFLATLWATERSE